MGPHFFKCGKSCDSGKWRSARPCFNGAALFQVRKGEPIGAFEFHPLGFNGAALFQVRKDTERIEKSHGKRNASMGPHFFKCGKRRGFEHVSACARRASMGPHFFKCGKDSQSAAKDWFGTLLQWGRTFSSAESIQLESFIIVR